MPDFESRRLPATPFSLSTHQPHELQADQTFPDDVLEDQSPAREGLPSGFRMRHDAHYVDQLTARSPVPQVRTIPIRAIDAGRLPHGADIDSLARSISSHGLLQPLLVRSRHGRYELIGGRRRLAAAAAAGLTDVPCTVHTCDDERALALANADNLRANEVRAQVPEQRGQESAAGLQELRRSIGTIESCLHLLGSRDGTLRDRVALDLVRTEAQRAGRLVRCLEIVTHDPPLGVAPVALRTLVEQVLDGFGPERRLSGVSVAVECTEGDHVASVDAEWLSVGIAGALAAMMALVQPAKSPTLQVRLSTTPGRASHVIEISQHAVAVPAGVVSRLFDVEWTERPGGYQAAVELAAARLIVARHGGAIEAAGGDRGSCRLMVILPAA